MDFTRVIYVAPYKWRYFSLLIGSFGTSLYLGWIFLGCLRLPARVEKTPGIGIQNVSNQNFRLPILGRFPTQPRRRRKKKKHVGGTLVPPRRLERRALEMRIHFFLSQNQPGRFFGAEKIGDSSCESNLPPPPAGHEGV